MSRRATTIEAGGARPPVDGETLFALLASAERLMERLAALPPCDLMDDLERDQPEVCAKLRKRFPLRSHAAAEEEEEGATSSLTAALFAAAAAAAGVVAAADPADRRRQCRRAWLDSGLSARCALVTDCCRLLRAGPRLLADLHAQLDPISADGAESVVHRSSPLAATFLRLLALVVQAALVLGSERVAPVAVLSLQVRAAIEAEEREDEEEQEMHWREQEDAVLRGLAGGGSLSTTTEHDMAAEMVAAAATDPVGRVLQQRLRPIAARVTQLLEIVVAPAIGSVATAAAVAASGALDVLPAAPPSTLLAQQHLSRQDSLVESCASGGGGCGGDDGSATTATLLIQRPSSAQQGDAASRPSTGRSDLTACSNAPAGNKARRSTFGGGVFEEEQQGGIDDERAVAVDADASAVVAPLLVLQLDELKRWALFALLACPDALAAQSSRRLLALLLRESLLLLPHGGGDHGGSSSLPLHPLFERAATPTLARVCGGGHTSSSLEDSPTLVRDAWADAASQACWRERAARRRLATAKLREAADWLSSLPTKGAAFVEALADKQDSLMAAICYGASECRWYFEHAEEEVQVPSKQQQQQNQQPGRVGAARSAFRAALAVGRGGSTSISSAAAAASTPVPTVTATPVPSDPALLELLHQLTRVHELLSRRRAEVAKGAALCARRRAAAAEGEQEQRDGRHSFAEACANLSATAALPGAHRRLKEAASVIEAIRREALARAEVVVGQVAAAAAAGTDASGDDDNTFAVFARRLELRASWLRVLVSLGTKKRDDDASSSAPPRLCALQVCAAARDPQIFAAASDVLERRLPALEGFAFLDHGGGPPTAGALVDSCFGELKAALALPGQLAKLVALAHSVVSSAAVAPAPAAPPASARLLAAAPAALRALHWAARDDRGGGNGSCDEANVDQAAGEVLQLLGSALKMAVAQAMRAGVESGGGEEDDDGSGPTIKPMARAMALASGLASLGLSLPITRALTVQPQEHVRKALRACVSALLSSVSVAPGTLGSELPPPSQLEMRTRALLFVCARVQSVLDVDVAGPTDMLELLLLEHGGSAGTGAADADAELVAARASSPVCGGLAGKFGPLPHLAVPRGVAAAADGSEGAALHFSPSARVATLASAVSLSAAAAAASAAASSSSSSSGLVERYACMIVDAVLFADGDDVRYDTDRCAFVAEDGGDEKQHHASLPELTALVRLFGPGAAVAVARRAEPAVAEAVAQLDDALLEVDGSNDSDARLMLERVQGGRAAGLSLAAAKRLAHALALRQLAGAALERAMREEAPLVAAVAGAVGHRRHVCDVFGLPRPWQTSAPDPFLAALLVGTASSAERLRRWCAWPTVLGVAASRGAKEEEDDDMRSAALNLALATHAAADRALDLGARMLRPYGTADVAGDSMVAFVQAAGGGGAAALNRQAGARGGGADQRAASAAASMLAAAPASDLKDGTCWID